MKLLLDEIHSQMGTLLLVADEQALCALDFSNAEKQMMQRLMARYKGYEVERVSDPHGFSRSIQAYLIGKYNAIKDIPVNSGGTSFQQQVWSALRKIPSGTTTSYGKLASQLGKPKAARAVGMANSLNPIVIVIPCHRVIGANAALTGYSGGLERKKWLLNHERIPFS